ncbi:putative MFS-type transporter, partial [Halobacillus sp. BAB-2008]
LLVSVMTSQAEPSEGLIGLIHGVNVSFIVAGIFAILGLVMSIFLTNSQPSQEYST